MIEDGAHEIRTFRWHIALKAGVLIFRNNVLQFPKSNTNEKNTYKNQKIFADTEKSWEISLKQETDGEEVALKRKLVSCCCN